MPEKNQTPIEMLDQNAAVVQSAEVPAPASPIQLQQRQSYAEKVQGLTIDERNWMLAKSKAAAMAQLPAGFLPQTYTGNPGALYRSVPSRNIRLVNKACKGCD